tara:strand:- start:2902 stop:3480 length:579 start_codon:yes stop_codon:yes gene_type:complete
MFIANKKEAPLTGLTGMGGGGTGLSLKGASGPLYFVFNADTVTLTRDTGNNANNGSLADVFDGGISNGLSFNSFDQGTLNALFEFDPVIPVNNGSFRVYWIPQDNCGGTGRCGNHAINGGSFSNNSTFSNGQFLWDSFSVSSLSSFHIKMTSSSPGSWGNSLAIKGFEIDGVILAYNDEVYNDGRNPSVEEP